MNTKNLILILMLSLLLIGLAGVRLTTEAAVTDNAAPVSSADDTAELVLTFEVRIRLPLLNKELL